MGPKLSTILKALAVSGSALLLYFLINLIFTIRDLLTQLGVEHVAFKHGKFILDHGERVLTMFDVPFMGTGTIVGAIAASLLIVGASRLRSKGALNYLGFTRFNLGDISLFLLCYIVLVAVSPIIERMVPALHSEEMDTMITAGLLHNPAWTFLAVGVAAPFLEELIFRGWLFRAFESSLSPIIALVVTSLMFSFVHLQYAWPILLVLTAMSFLLGAVRLRTGSLWPSIIMHCCNNMLGAGLLLAKQ